MPARLTVECLLGLPLSCSLLLAQGQQQSSGTFCNQQDRLFAANFDTLGVLIAAGGAFFLLPLLLSRVLAARWWTFAGPVRRWTILAGVCGILVLFLFAGLPWLALGGTIAPGAGLMAYPGVEARYVTVCPNESFRETGVFFGLLGTPRKAAVAQPYALVTGLLIAAVAWSGVYWVVTLAVKKKRGLAAS
jgi:hypothetical protein